MPDRHSLPEDGGELNLQPLTEVDLTAAALWVLGLRDDPLLQSCYRGALGTWAIMLSMDDEQALAHAETLASRPVRATVPPF
jgi:hypothetical protein